MDVMFVLIGFSLVVALVFLGAFLWAVRSGQYDDQYTPSVRMLFDEQPVRAMEESTKEDAIQTDYRSKE